MTAQDRALLRQSLLEDGWTQPIVTLMDATIVDGEQRWTTSGLPLHPSDIQAIIDKLEGRKEQGYEESESILMRLHAQKARLEEVIARGERGCIASLTGGLVPITRVDFSDDAHKMISTIRHNRARGSHSIDKMADIASDLMQQAYVVAKAQFDLIDAERDWLLAPIDYGERTVLSDMEREMLERLNSQLATAYRSVLAAEQNMLTWAREREVLRH